MYLKLRKNDTYSKLESDFSTTKVSLTGGGIAEIEAEIDTQLVT